MNGLGLLAALLGSIYLIALVEEWTTMGRFRLVAPLLAGPALLGRESLVPRSADRLLFEVAPPLVLLAALLAAAVLPLAPGTVFANLATGILFVNAALVYVMVALIMAGWGPDGAYAMIGGWRFLGQFIAYGMLVVMPIAAVGMRAQSLVTTTVVQSQFPIPNAITQPLGFVVFILAAMAICYLPPFDLPTAPSVLAGGVLGEYTGVRLAIIRLGRLVLVLTLAASITVFYLGGWLGPLLPAAVWTLLKMLVVAIVMLVAGRFVPRLTEEDILAWAWKLGIPLALANILWVGVTLLLVA